MTSEESETMTPLMKRLQTYALDRMARGVGKKLDVTNKIIVVIISTTVLC